jgi:hypothetical protein
MKQHQSAKGRPSSPGERTSQPPANPGQSALEKLLLSRSFAVIRVVRVPRKT